jgi:hypothetical protein
LVIIVFREEKKVDVKVKQPPKKVTVEASLEPISK